MKPSHKIFDVYNKFAPMTQFERVLHTGISFGGFTYTRSEAAKPKKVRMYDESTQDWEWSKVYETKFTCSSKNKKMPVELLRAKNLGISNGGKGPKPKLKCGACLFILLDSDQQKGFHQGRENGETVFYFRINKDVADKEVVNSHSQDCITFQNLRANNNTPMRTQRQQQQFPVNRGGGVPVPVPLPNAYGGQKMEMEGGMDLSEDKYQPVFPHQQQQRRDQQQLPPGIQLPQPTRPKISGLNNWEYMNVNRQRQQEEEKKKKKGKQAWDYFQFVRIAPQKVWTHQEGQTTSIYFELGPKFPPQTPSVNRTPRIKLYFTYKQTNDGGKEESVQKCIQLRSQNWNIGKSCIIGFPGGDKRKCSRLIVDLPCITSPCVCCIELGIDVTVVRRHNFQNGSLSTEEEVYKSKRKVATQFPIQYLPANLFEKMQARLNELENENQGLKQDLEAKENHNSSSLLSPEGDFDAFGPNLYEEEGGNYYDDQSWGSSNTFQSQKFKQDVYQYRYVVVESESSGQVERKHDGMVLLSKLLANYRNTRDSNGFSLAHYFVYFDLFDATAVVLKDNPKAVNCVDNDGNPPLFFCRSDRVRDLLISSGAELEKRNYFEENRTEYVERCNNTMFDEFDFGTSATAVEAKVGGVEEVKEKKRMSVKKFYKGLKKIKVLGSTKGSGNSQIAMEKSLGTSKKIIQKSPQAIHQQVFEANLYTKKFVKGIIKKFEELAEGKNKGKVYQYLKRLRKSVDVNEESKEVDFIAFSHRLFEKMNTFMKFFLSDALRMKVMSLIQNEFVLPNESKEFYEKSAYLWGEKDAVKFLKSAFEFEEGDQYFESHVTLYDVIGEEFLKRVKVGGTKGGKSKGKFGREVQEILLKLTKEMDEDLRHQFEDHITMLEQSSKFSRKELIYYQNSERMLHLCGSVSQDLRNIFEIAEQEQTADDMRQKYERFVDEEDRIQCEMSNCRKIIKRGIVKTLKKLKEDPGNAQEDALCCALGIRDNLKKELKRMSVITYCA